MNRTPRTATLLLTGPALLGLGLAAAGPAAAAAPGTARPAAVVCPATSPIMVGSFAFDPAEVKPGDSSDADLVTVNCSAYTVGTVEQWTGEWLPLTGSGPVAGCPVIDPLSRDVTYAPGEEVDQSVPYSVPTTCTATALEVTVEITLPAGSTSSIVKATAVLRIVQPTG
jgi:hypothetical protein